MAGIGKLYDVISLNHGHLYHQNESYEKISNVYLNKENKE